MTATKQFVITELSRSTSVSIGIAVSDFGDKSYLTVTALLIL
jgi:hypothetical protein